MHSRNQRFGALMLIALGVSACTVKKTQAPPLAGPSEFGLALNLAVSPDVLTQDGVSQSQITVQARDANGQPARNVAIRAEITVAGVPADFGTLSGRTFVTDSAGRVFIVYTAPPFAGDSVDRHTIVTVLVTPASSDNRNAAARSVDIRLVPPGVILPPNDGPVPRFTFSPASPIALSTVLFDGSSSTDSDGIIVSFSWNFGDGSSATGQQASHQFRIGGDFHVVLTVTDDRGNSVSTDPTDPATVVTVSDAAGPTAAFSFSPDAPVANQNIFFNGVASTAAPGHRVVRYAWNFGNGTTQQGVTVVNAYSVAGTYNVTLTVTDDVGLKNTITQQVTVLP